MSWPNCKHSQAPGPFSGTLLFLRKTPEGPVPFLVRNITGREIFASSGMNKMAQLRTVAPGAWFIAETPAPLAKRPSLPELWTHIKGLGIPRNTWSIQPPNCAARFIFHIFLLVLEPPPKFQFIAYNYMASVCGIYAGFVVMKMKKEEWVFLFPFSENKEDKENSEQAWTFFVFHFNCS